MNTTAPTGYIRGFDGLRAISIALVLFTHYGGIALLPPDPFIRERVWRLIAGTTGVNIFFVLSGWLITGILIRDAERHAGKINLKRFYIRRFLRLTPPLLLFFVAIGIGSLLGVYHVRLLNTLASFFYLYNYVPRALFEGELLHTWSLAVEEQFYLVWPFLMLVTPRRWWARIALVMIALAAVAALLLPQVSLQHHDHVYPLRVLFDLPHWFLPAAGPILVGALASVLAYRHPARAAILASAPWVLPGAVIAFASPLYLPSGLLPISPIIQAAGIALLLMWIVAHQDALLTRSLEFRPLAYIGKISYGIYLYHMLIIGKGAAGMVVKDFPLNLVLILGLSMASYELYERPILRLKEKFH